MRKFTLILASLMMTVGALAQDGITFNTASYTVKSVNRGYLYYESNNGDFVTSSSHTTLTDATPTGDVVEQFAFLSADNTAEGECYMYSIAAEKFVTYTGKNGVALELTETPSCTWQLVKKDEYYVITVPGTTNNTCINITNWQAKFGCKVTGTAADDGNKMTLTAVDNNVELGTALVKINKFEGNYFATPETGKYYKIKGEGELPWLTANTTDGGNVVVSANEADAAVFKKTANGLQAVATGKYLGYSSGKYTYSDTELDIELRTNDDYLANYSNKYAIVSGGNYMFNNNNDGIVHESNRQLDLPRLWAFTVVEARIGDTYYATFEDAMAAEGSDDVELLVEKAITLDDANAYTYTKGAYDVDVAYSRDLIPGIWNPVYIPFDATVLADEFEVAEFTAAEGTTITLTKLEANEDGEEIDLSANTAYVVRPVGGNNKLELSAWGYIFSNEVLPPLPLGDGFSVRGNYSKLTGADLDEETDRVVNGQTGNWGVLKSASTLKPFRLILRIPAGVDASAISMRVEGEDTTSIETLETMTKTTIYDLMGRRVETMTEGGIYIVNGKKVIR